MCQTKCEHPERKPEKGTCSKEQINICHGDQKEDSSKKQTQ